MELYSFEDANRLIDYYSPKMIGGLLEASTGSKVVRLFMEDFGEKKYVVYGEGTIIHTVVKPKRSIDLIAITQALLSPNDVLKDLNQQK